MSSFDIESWQKLLNQIASVAILEGILHGQDPKGHQIDNDAVNSAVTEARSLILSDVAMLLPAGQQTSPEQFSSPMFRSRRTAAAA